MDAVRSIEIIQLIETNQFETALKVLDQIPEDADQHGYSGLIHYLVQEYDTAVHDFTRATELNPEDLRWKELLWKSIQNQHASIDQKPQASLFRNKENIDALLAGTGTNVYPAPPVYAKNHHWTYAFKTGFGNTAGSVASFVLEFITTFWGRIGGYKDALWTNWYRKPIFLGILSLAHMRNLLNKHNLYATYTRTEKDYYKRLLKNKPDYSTQYRTYNGTYNNPDHPVEGAAGTRFQRNVSPPSSNKISDDDLLSPNPRWISRVLLTRHGEMKKAPHINMLAAAWIQFQNHDWVSHPEASLKSCYSIDIAVDDPIRKLYHQTKLFVGKTPHDPTASVHSPYTHNYINEVTHWWDGSQIYGSDEATCLNLRSGIGGKLRVTSDGHLLTDPKGMEISGYTRNWWVGLSLFHTLFTLEHNAICDTLKSQYPDWSDDQLFHTSRLINAALMAKIHTLEWNSAINPNAAIYKGNHSNWYGLLTTMLRKKQDWHTIATINIRNTELGGVVGNPINKYNVDFGLTEEFVEAYRIHSMLPETLSIQDLVSKKELATISFASTRYTGAARCIKNYGIPSLWYSLGLQNPGQVVLNNYPRFMQELSIPGNPIYDMGAVDLLRARERGIPRYNEFRRQLGLNPIQSFLDLTSDSEVIEKLKLIYGNDAMAVERLDFMIGTLAEARRPFGFAFGETMFQLFLLNATRRLQADRFYTDCYTDEYYTSVGMNWIDRHTLKDVLLRHYPMLKNSGLANITNAFEPWDEGPELDPQRHPLRAFDKELRNDPWVGNTYRNQSQHH